MRGRRPKPTGVKRAEGSRRVRKDDAEPKYSNAAKAPSWIKGEARKEWRRVAGEMAAAGTLTSVCVATLAAYCQAVADHRAAVLELEQLGRRTYETESGQVKPRPEVAMVREAASLVMRLAAELGLTPSAASRVRIPGPASMEPEGIDAFAASKPQPILRIAQS